MKRKRGCDNGHHPAFICLRCGPSCFSSSKMHFFLSALIRHFMRHKDRCFPMTFYINLFNSFSSLSKSIKTTIFSLCRHVIFHLIQHHEYEELLYMFSVNYSTDSILYMAKFIANLFTLYHLIHWTPSYRKKMHF